MSHGLLLGESEGSPRAGGGEARVGVHWLSGRLLRVGVLRQESNRRVSWGGLRLRKVFHVADALVAHVFSRVQQLLWTPPRVLRGEDRRRREKMTLQGHRVFFFSQEGWLYPQLSVITSLHYSAQQNSGSEPQRFIQHTLLYEQHW